MKVLTKNGEQGTVTIDKKAQTARLNVGNREYLICYMRDNKVKVKNSDILGETDLAHVREEMKQFVKVVETKSKKRR